MLVVIEEPDYLPEAVLAWARERQEILDLIVGEFLETGAWPTTTGLTRSLARSGQAVPLSSILREMPRQLGFVENHPGKIVLLLYGLRLTTAGTPLLEGFASLVRLALERYKGADETPLVTRSDLGQIGVTDTTQQLALSEIFLREAPFYGGAVGIGGPEDDWSREISDLIVNYWDVQTADDYLRIRARELAMSPQFGFPPPEPVSASASDTLGDMRDVFISHASEDKEEVARPLAEALQRRGLSVWFDEYELVLGDKLRGKIEEGIARSTLGVVILSEAFFSKQWPQQELDGLYARLVEGEFNVIVPIWHRLTREIVTERAPTIAGLLAGNTVDGVAKLADDIGRTLARRRRSHTSEEETDPVSPPGPAAPVLLPESAESAAVGLALPTEARAASPSGVGRRPPLGSVNFDMETGALNIAALELIRDDDTIALQHMFNDAIARARQAIEQDEIETTLAELLDKLVCLAATFLTLDQGSWVESVIDVFTRIYGMPLGEGDAQRFEYSTQFSPQEIAPRVWLAILLRIFGLGALSVRLERWDIVRPVVLQRPQGAGDYERNWLRHGLTMAARAELLRERRDERTIELSLLSLARDVVMRLACMRSDGVGAEDDEILTSLAQFDALSNLVAIDDSGDIGGRDFYPNFARFYAHRVTPAVSRLLSDGEMRAVLFTRDDDDLALALRAVGDLARKAGWSVDGFEGWNAEINDFIAKNLPSETTG
jgi:hypothetical protein